MILTESEVKTLDVLCDYIIGNGYPIQIPCVQRYSEPYSPNYTEITLSNTKLSLRIYESSYSSILQTWELYVNGTAIHREDDGLWWDIVRLEIPNLAEKVSNYYDARKNNHRQTMEYMAKRRDKELQRAKDYINGWRWWKFWWTKTSVCP